MHTPAIVIVGLLALSTAFALQDKPDFSGRWVLESSPESISGIASAMTVTQSIRRTNIRGEPIPPHFDKITIERVLNGRNWSETRNIGVVGGSVPGLNDDGTSSGRYTHFEVRWDGDALVFVTRRSTEPAPRTGEWDEHQEVWSLDPDDRLRVETTVRTTGASNTVTLVYRRQ